MKELFPVENPTIVVFLLLGVKHFEVKGYLVGHKDFWLVMFFFFLFKSHWENFSAYRSSSVAMLRIGIPKTDGIIYIWIVTSI